MNANDFIRFNSFNTNEQNLIEYARIMCELQKEECAKSAKSIVDGGGEWVSSAIEAKVIKSSILDCKNVCN